MYRPIEIENRKVHLFYQTRPKTDVQVDVVRRRRRNLSYRNASFEFFISITGTFYSMRAYPEVFSTRFLTRSPKPRQDEYSISLSIIFRYFRGGESDPKIKRKKEESN